MEGLLFGWGRVCSPQSAIGAASSGQSSNRNSSIHSKSNSPCRFWPRPLRGCAHSRWRCFVPPVSGWQAWAMAVHGFVQHMYIQNCLSILHQGNAQRLSSRERHQVVVKSGWYKCGAVVVQLWHPIRAAFAPAIRPPSPADMRPPPYTLMHLQPRQRPCKGVATERHSAFSATRSVGLRSFPG